VGQMGKLIISCDDFVTWRAESRAAVVMREQQCAVARTYLKTI